MEPLQAVLHCITNSNNLIEPFMIDTLLDAILQQIDQPKKDLEKNLRALLNESIEKLDLVSKDELERQKIALNLANQRLATLQQQVKTLEEMVHKLQ